MNVNKLQPIKPVRLATVSPGELVMYEGHYKDYPHVADAMYIVMRGVKDANLVCVATGAAVWADRDTMVYVLEHELTVKGIKHRRSPDAGRI